MHITKGKTKQMLLVYKIPRICYLHSFSIETIPRHRNSVHYNSQHQVQDGLSQEGHLTW
jgi:hypothetical protein